MRTVDEIGEMLSDAAYPIDYGEFPMAWTAYNDLSLDFLWKKLIEFQQRDIGRIAQCVQQLHEPVARALAERSLGAAQAHLDGLREAQAAAPGR
jgi:hypothetical protein